MKYGVENRADGVEFWFDVRKSTGEADADTDTTDEKA